MSKKAATRGPKGVLVTIRSFDSEVEAELAKTKLESEGIKSFLSGDDCGGLRPAMTFTNGIKLVVRADRATRAEEILRDGSES
jgi:hypothetical protein